MLRELALVDKGSDHQTLRVRQVERQDVPGSTDPSPLHGDSTESQVIETIARSYGVDGSNTGS
jgi:hypothetical protein